MIMEVYIVQYVHSSEKDIYSWSQPFTDAEKARNEFNRRRQMAIEVARDDDPDLDEECPRDYTFKQDTPNWCLIRVRDYNEFIEVRLQRWTIS